MPKKRPMYPPGSLTWHDINRRPLTDRIAETLFALAVLALLCLPMLMKD